MNIEQFRALSETEKLKTVKRAMKACSNLDNKKNMPTQREIEILHCAAVVTWQNPITSMEKRVWKKNSPKS